MAFKLSVRCHGMGALAEATEGDQAAVLLPRAERTVVARQAVYVKFPAASYQGPRPITGARGNEAHVVLHQERLTIVANAAKKNQKLQILRNKDPLGSSTPTSADATSLAWLANLSELSRETSRDSRGPGELKDEYFLTPATSTPPLIARVDFMQGRLGTTGVDPVLVTFSNRTRTSDVIRRPVARELLLELDIEDDSFTLMSQRWDGSVDEAKTMTFKSRDNIEIVIGNESEDDIYLPAAPTLPLDVLSGRCMAEFDSYFRMLSIEPKDPLLPFLAARPGSGTCCEICDGSSRLVHDFPAISSAPSSASTTEFSSEEPITRERPWTALTFIAADNSLSLAAEGDLDELEKVDPDSVGVVVQIDRPRRDAEHLLLERGGFASTKLGDLNFGDPKVLSTFLREGRAARPAKNYAVIFPTHGNGLLDFSFGRPPRHVANASWERLLRDFNANARSTRAQRPGLQEIDSVFGRHVQAAAQELDFDERDTLHLLSLGPAFVGPDDSHLDFIDNEELVTGLRGGLDSDEDRFAILGFDACVMGLVEMAYQVRKLGQYFVASQDNVSSEGWRYEEIFGQFTDKTTPRKGAEIMVDVYKKATDKDPFATLSAVDLSAIEGVAVALNELGDRLQPIVKPQLNALARARNDARAFSTFHYIDLYEFVRAIKTHLGTQKGIDSAADDVLKKVKDAVIATSKDDRQASRAHGLSVYVPNSPVAEEYNRLSMSTDATTKRWHDFVVEYAALR
jgi:hypothetical protein